MSRRQNTLCKLHTLRAVQIGSCLVCSSSSAICETKGCIKHHSELQKMHTTYAVKQIQKISDDFTRSNEEKRHIIRQLISKYFQTLKTQVESLYQQVSHAIDHLRFQNFLMDQSERKLAELIITKRYSDLTCSEIARIIPKMLKCGSFEEKQFNHLKDYLIFQEENLRGKINSMILNLPYFRDDQTIVATQKFSEISDQNLGNVNRKIEALTYKPKKLRIKYCNYDLIQAMTQQKLNNLGPIIRKQFFENEKFIKLLETNENLREVQVLQMNCLQCQFDFRWNISEQDFQIEFLDAVLSYPFLSSLIINTGYKVTSTEFIEEMTEHKNIELKIYKKDWSF